MIHMKPNALYGNQDGAATVELAIVFPLLILVIFGIIEFSLYLFNRQVITNAAREGARAGIVVRVNRMSNQAIETVVQNFTENHLVTFGTDNQLDVAILPVDTNLSDGFDPANFRCVQFECDLSVGVTFPYEFLFLSTVGIGPTHIQSVSTMRME